MRFVLTIALFLGASVSHADDNQKVIINGKEGTVLEAVKALMEDKNAEVYKCVRQDLKANKTTMGLKKKD